MEIKGKIAVVTGAATGRNTGMPSLGSTFAVELARRGARVALVDKNSSQGTLDQIVANGGTARMFMGDVTDADFRRSVFDAMETEFDDVVRITIPAAGIAINKRGIYFDKDSGTYVMASEADFLKVIRINQLAPTFWSEETALRIAKRRCEKLGSRAKWGPDDPIEGVIVFVGSIIDASNDGQGSYEEAKSALRSFSAGFSTEMQPHGVLVKLVKPGYTLTEMTAGLSEKDTLSILADTQLKRFCTVDEIWKCVNLLIEVDPLNVLSPDAGWRRRAA